MSVTKYLLDKVSCFHVLVAAAIKELRAQVLNFMASMVRHYTMVAIAQQCGRSTSLLEVYSSPFLSYRSERLIFWAGGKCIAGFLSYSVFWHCAC